MPQRALITGITGQDGSYLAELLLSKGYEVHGLVRPGPVLEPCAEQEWLEPLLQRIYPHAAALEQADHLAGVIAEVLPDECYHLAAQSFTVATPAEESTTMVTNVTGTHHLLGAVREIVPQCRFFFAGSSEMFGQVTQAPQNESTPFRPRSIYGISKVAAGAINRHYREAYGLHASMGLLFNHESPRRGRRFVTRKITAGVAAIRAGQAQELRLGNLDAERDWGYAPDYVEAMWLMLQQDTPDDYVLATGATHSVREFVELAFAAAGLDWRSHVVVDPQFQRPPERHPLVGDATKAGQQLGWRAKATFAELVRKMVEEDCRRMGVMLPSSGSGTPSSAARTLYSCSVT